LKAPRTFFALIFAAAIALSAINTSASAADAAKRLNIVIILADDMGFSDVGCYGGEIHTPNIDHFATQGVRFSQFYNMARCCPTRAALLTGLSAPGGHGGDESELGRCRV
jgi:hypothetical protein